MKISSCLYLGAISLFGTAAAQTNQQVFINGVALQATTSTKNGETYYQFKASDLKRAGAITAGGVKPKTDAIKGCVGDTLFNGVYSVQLIKAGVSDDRFSVTLKLSNASKQELSSFSVFNATNVVAATDTSAMTFNNFVGDQTSALLPGTSTTFQAVTGGEGGATKWTRLLIRPGSDAIKYLQQQKYPLAKIYNMEFNLTCTKK
ncbi:hypothetical protein FNU79_12385 [Deinococcus detaillensis]|uniref:Uncharacterized protein n=1 Tax=Deinococcus detaillensis TaxID=2592048 RepID=A0A553USI4_9DEIO|nr:hypothetical protein [Deinococcus detaillensis]TSA83125.1 hypothetical protein FNU79_12385 [Deinococcus detaillensis]